MSFLDQTLKISGTQELDNLTGTLGRVTQGYQALNRQLHERSRLMQEERRVAEAMSAPGGSALGPVRGLAMGRENYAEQAREIANLAKSVRDATDSFDAFEKRMISIANQTGRAVQETTALNQQLAFVRDRQSRDAATASASQYAWGTGMDYGQVGQQTARLAQAGAIGKATANGTTPFDRSAYNEFLMGVEEAISRGSRNGFNIIRSDFLNDVTDLTTRRNTLTGQGRDGIGIAQNLSTLARSGNPSLVGAGAKNTQDALNNTLAGATGYAEMFMWGALKRVSPNMDYITFDQERYAGFDDPAKLKALVEQLDAWGMKDDATGNALASSMIFQGALTPGQVRSMRQAVTAPPGGDAAGADKARTIMGAEGASATYQPIVAQLLDGTITTEQAWDQYFLESGDRSQDVYRDRPLVPGTWAKTISGMGIPGVSDGLRAGNLDTDETRARQRALASSGVAGFAEYVSKQQGPTKGAYADRLEQDRNRTSNNYTEAARNFRTATEMMNRISIGLSNITKGGSGAPLVGGAWQGGAVIAGVGSTFLGGMVQMGGLMLGKQALGSLMERRASATSGPFSWFKGVAKVAEEAEDVEDALETTARPAGRAAAGAARTAAPVARAAGTGRLRGAGRIGAGIAGVAALGAIGYGAYQHFRGDGAPATPPPVGPTPEGGAGVPQEEKRNARTRTGETEKQTGLLRRLVAWADGSGQVATDKAYQQRAMGGPIPVTMNAASGISSSAAATAASSSSSGGGKTTPGAGFGGASAGSMQGVIDKRSASNGKQSPFTGAMLAEVEAKTGVPAALMMGILMKESQLGTDSGALNGVNNFGGIKATDADIKAGRFIETDAGKFRTFASPQEYLEHMAALLQGDYYAGKPLEEVIGNYYAGPGAYAANGVNATDGAGNGTVQQYVDMVLDIIYSLLGVRPSQKDVPIARVAGGGGGTMFGSRQTITQLPGGATSHRDLNGVDFAGGGPVHAPAGGTITGLLNTVGPNDGKTAGGGYGNHIKVRTDDNRYEYLVAHFAPGSLKGLRVGGKIAAGQYLGEQGETGNSTGVHTHVELLSHDAKEQNVLGWLQDIGAVGTDLPTNLGPGGTGGPEGDHDHLTLDGGEGDGGEVVTFAPLRLTLDTPSGATSLLDSASTKNPYSGLRNFARKVIK